MALSTSLSLRISSSALEEGTMQVAATNMQAHIVAQRCQSSRPGAARPLAACRPARRQQRAKGVVRAAVAVEYEAKPVAGTKSDDLAVNGERDNVAC